MTADIFDEEDIEESGPTVAIETHLIAGGGFDIVSL
jgi:hypothetical protein